MAHATDEIHRRQSAAQPPSTCSCTRRQHPQCTTGTNHNLPLMASSTDFFHRHSHTTLRLLLPAAPNLRPPPAPPAAPHRHSPTTLLLLPPRRVLLRRLLSPPLSNHPPAPAPCAPCPTPPPQCTCRGPGGAGGRGQAARARLRGGTTTHGFMTCTRTAVAPIRRRDCHSSATLSRSGRYANRGVEGTSAE